MGKSNKLDFSLWLLTELGIEDDEYRVMPKGEKSLLRKQYQQYVDSESAEL